MQLKQKVTSLIKNIIKLPIWITIPVAVVFTLLMICFVLFLQVKSVQFSYSDKTCAQQLTFLPDLSKQDGGESSFSAKNENYIKIGGLKLFSLETCFTAKKVPNVGDSKLSIAPFGGWLARKSFKIYVPKPPVARLEFLSKPIPTMKPLAINLSANDTFFEYQLGADGKTTTCNSKNSVIYCDIASLNLIQDKDYTLELVRKFDDKVVTTLVSKNIKTLSATTVVGSSIIQDQIIYDKPKTFTFTFDKDVAKGNIILEKVEGEKRTVANISSIIQDKLATVSIDSDLDRDSIYEFSIEKLEAKDGSTLPAPYKLSFKSSDGPSVASVNVGSTGLSTSQTVILTFDQALATDTNIANFVSTSGIATSISRLNNQVYIRYENASMCTDLNISVKAGLISGVGVIQNDSWGYTTRTVCHTVSVVGYSKEGRPIVAYIFGNGGRTILYTGAIHGNELSAKYLMEAWVDELEVNARSVPTDKRIVIIPSLNPDGVATNRRNNSSNVDLNRNFPTYDWQSDIYTPANQPLPGGGGASPLSEPESQAIATFTTQLSPRLTMSFHSNASYAIANQAGDSNSLAATYSQLSGYRNMTGVGGAFSYPITGTYDDWLRDKYSLTSVLIELASSTNTEFSRNKAALWAMARS